MRWRMTLNTLRTKRGKFELGAQILSTGFFSMLWLLFGASFGFAAFEFTRHGMWKSLPMLFWVVLGVWQMLPVVIASAQGSVDPGLARFPVSLGSYLLLYLSLGIFDLASIFGGIALTGIGLGVVIARPALLPWVVITLALFAIFNLLLTRAVFAWIERWMAQRRTREVLGVIFLLFFVGLQLLNPAWHQHDLAINQAKLFHILQIANMVQQVFPPGLAAKSIASAASAQGPETVALIAALVLYAICALVVLGIRLRAEYRGESLAEVQHFSATRKAITRTDSEASLPAAQKPRLFDGPIHAVLTKDIRYLCRSTVMLFSLITPVVFLFLIGGQSRTSPNGLPVQFAFPMTVAYALLALTRMTCNSLGGEGAGIQIYFLSPTPFHTVMLAKNLLQSCLFCLELAAAAAIAFFRIGTPAPDVLLATLAWALFALPANLAVGNILSITMAYRMTLTRFSREQGSVGNALLSLLGQLLVVVIGGAIYLPLNAAGHGELVPLAFLLLALGAFVVWLRVLANVDSMAARRRETLIAALVRAA
jgi:ABC-2 type transport system permease protein